jgi:hypothetical protein
VWGASLAKATTYFKTKPLAFKYGFKEQLSQSIKDIKKIEPESNILPLFNDWVNLIKTKTNLSKTRSATIIVAAATAEAIARRNKRLVDALTREIILIKVLIQKMKERNAAKQAISEASTAAAAIHEPPDLEIQSTLFSDSEKPIEARAITAAVNHATVGDVNGVIKNKLTEYFKQKLRSLDHYIKEIQNARIVNLVTSFICSTVVTYCEYDVNTDLKSDMDKHTYNEVTEKRRDAANVGGYDPPVDGYRLPDENRFGFNPTKLGVVPIGSVKLLVDDLGKIPCWRRATTSDNRCNRSDFENPPCSSVGSRDISLAAVDGEKTNERREVHNTALRVKDGCGDEIKEKLNYHISQKVLKTLLNKVKPDEENPVSFEEWTTLNDNLTKVEEAGEVERSAMAVEAGQAPEGIEMQAMAPLDRS